VFSRVGVLWGVTNVAPAAQTHWAFTLMVLSWALVEVPRYAFYVVKTVADDVPFPLKWLRYSLFIVLYPSGITGEVLSLWAALPYVLVHSVWTVALPNPHNLVFNYYIALWVMLAVYLPGGPFMFSHMWRQRGKELKAKTE